MLTPGLTTRITSSTIPVLRLHYSSDPRKRPGTPEGDAWLISAVQGYPGGLKSPRWRKEQEIDYGALGGTRLFPEWEQWIGMGKIVIPPFEPEGYKLYGSFDHGWRNPACYHVHAINGDGNIVSVYEIYGSHIPVSRCRKTISSGCGICTFIIVNMRWYRSNSWFFRVTRANSNDL